MIRNSENQLRHYLLAALLTGACLTFWNCSGEKKSETNADESATADSSFMGRQGDTLNSSSMDAPQQAPPDSASARGAVVPAEVKVTPKE